MSSLSEFSDRPFVAGSIMGLRAFRVDRLGRLTATQFPDPWRPGENVAVCHAQDPMVGGSPGAAASAYQNAMSQIVRSMSATLWTGGTGGNPITSPTPYQIAQSAQSLTPSVSEMAVEAGEPLPEPRHQVGQVKCTCGFYAYFDGSNRYARSDSGQRVSGIIEGYGVCTVGSAGFRAAKARIVALVFPERTSLPWTEVDYYEVARTRYPDIPVYPTVTEALETHPVSPPARPKPDLPSPETAKDFWTMEAPPNPIQWV